jgi:hypothetical protein
MLWKKNRSVSKTAKLLKMRYITVEKALLFSRFYIKYYKENIARDTTVRIITQMDEKGSPYRNKVALALRTWRKTHSIIKTAKILKVGKRKARFLLRTSRFFLSAKAKHKTTHDGKKEWINEKGSKYRNKIASCLKIWRINRSINETANELNLHKERVWFLLSRSKIYRKIKENQKERDRKKRRGKHYTTEYILRWAKKIKAIGLLGGKCKQCGNNNIFHLEFHHFKNDKEHEVNRVWGLRWETIKKEINKCILLCRNCHMSLHHSTSKNRRVFQEYKEQLLKIKNVDGCEKCGYDSDISAIDFHHNGKKEFNIGAYYRNQQKPSCINRVLKELDKCSVLCKNCHKVEHIDLEKFCKMKRYIDEAIIMYFKNRS